MEVICINGTFDKEVKDFFDAFGVVTPEQDSIYSIRETINHSKGLCGVRLHEIKNPKVPQFHSILGKILIEPSFSIDRFRTLNGDIVTEEAIKESVKETVKIPK